MVWTEFWDMHSGGYLKEEPYQYIYLEAPIEEAIKLFEDRFGHDPQATACPCCGPNYVIDEDLTLDQATAYDRNCTVEEFGNREDVLYLSRQDLGLADHR